MIMPCRWQAGDLNEFAGRVCFRRRFGYPGRIDSSERVWLTLDGFSGLTTIRLNGVFLEHSPIAEGRSEVPITELLQERNELVLEQDARTGQDNPWGEVALEVRCTAYLRRVRAWFGPADLKPAIQVAGEVVGSAERPLDLYVLVNGATGHYSTVKPSSEGAAFQVLLEDLASADEQAIRVELVNGGVLWYVAECRSESTPAPPGQ
jgi:hypothetical protein